MHVDHVVSVADGGGNDFDNLVSACSRCNGGKSAQSLGGLTCTTEVLNNVTDEKERNHNLIQEMREVIESRKEMRQEVVNIVCEAYNQESFTISENDISAIARMIQRYGAALVIEWLDSAGSRCVPLHQTVRYVRGCARTYRERKEAGGT